MIFGMFQLHSVARVWPSDKKPPFKLSIAGSRHLSSVRGFEQRESAALAWSLLSVVHMCPLFQAGMASFQTRWSAGPCGTMWEYDFPSETLFASSAHAHATVASRQLDVT